jgi:hypothetical protein
VVGQSEGEDAMAIAVYFSPESMTMDQFMEVHRLLGEAGASNPKGRIHHSCFGEDGHLMVYDIWESEADFDAFGETLMPLVAQIGLDVGPPQVMQIQRLEQREVK